MHMNKKMVLAGVLALTLAMPLMACGGTSSGSTATTPASSSSKSFDANKFYVGQWRGAVEITGQTVYGTAGGSEQMLDVNIEDDGTCTVVPLEAHADLLNASGTWEGTEDELTLKLGSGKTITLKSDGKSTLSAAAADFDIADFDTITFDFYG